MNENAALERARGFRVVYPARGVGFGLLWEPAVLGVQVRGNAWGEFFLIDKFR